MEPTEEPHVRRGSSKLSPVSDIHATVTFVRFRTSGLPPQRFRTRLVLLDERRYMYSPWVKQREPLQPLTNVFCFTIIEGVLSRLISTAHRTNTRRPRTL